MKLSLYSSKVRSQVAKALKFALFNTFSRCFQKSQFYRKLQRGNYICIIKANYVTIYLCQQNIIFILYLTRCFCLRGLNFRRHQSCKRGPWTLDVAQELTPMAHHLVGAGKSLGPNTFCALSRLVVWNTCPLSSKK